MDQTRSDPIINHCTVTLSSSFRQFIASELQKLMPSSLIQGLWTPHCFCKSSSTLLPNKVFASSE